MTFFKPLPSLGTKHIFTKEQLALAMELWNATPTPNCFVFRHGDASNVSKEVPEKEWATFDPINVEHLIFQPALPFDAVVPAAPLPVGPSPNKSHKKKKK